ncbi:hypothetical protein P3S68_007697 [Capsicum galapagoense]
MELNKELLEGLYSLEPYIACVDQCEKTGCVGDKYSQHYNFTSGDSPIDGPWYLQDPLYLRWKQWDCLSDCRYHCMLAREEERKKVGLKPVKYHGKWPFQRVNGIQVDVDLTEKLDYSSAVALLGFSLILAVLRVFNVRDEAARVMVSAPLVAFVTTHILYLNCYQLDYGLNMKVCLAMGMLQLILWAVWAGVTCHPSRWKLWVVVIGGGLASLLEIYDFPPYMGFVDAHALWHGTTIPLTHLWWSFVRGDSEFRTTTLIKKAK